MITKTSRKLVCFLIVCAIIIKLFLLTDGERQSEDIVAVNGRKNLISGKKAREVAELSRDLNLIHYVTGELEHSSILSGVQT